MIEYLKDDEAEQSEGIILIVVFALLMFMQALVKNQYFIKGAILSINVRKTLISAMYKKV